MEKAHRTLFVFAITVIGAVLVVLAVPWILFFGCMLILTLDEGKLDNVEKVSEVVMENQETLQDIVAQVLEPEQELDIYIDVEEQKFQALGSSKDVDEALFHTEEICLALEEVYVQSMHIYKDSDMSMVIFQTNAAGLSVSGGCKGFLYLNQDWTEAVNEYNYFKVNRHRDYSEITDNWYYYDVWY